MLREYIYLTDDELQLVPICDDCGPNAVPIMRREEIVRCKDCRFYAEFPISKIGNQTITEKRCTFDRNDVHEMGFCDRAERRAYETD